MAAAAVVAVSTEPVYYSVTATVLVSGICFANIPVMPV
jgi:hypothetical protein